MAWSWVAEDELIYDELAGIAPTIPLLGDGQVDSWQDMTEVAGRFLDDPAGAGEVIAAVARLMADTAADLPGLAGKTFAMANYVPGDQLYVVADPEDGSSVFFQDPDPHDLVGYGQLPAVRAGSVADLGYAAVVDLNTPSPLSIPNSLDLVLPALRVAASP